MTGDSKRKLSHLAICANEEVGFKKKTTLFEELELVHRALPELDLAQLDTTCSFLGKTLSAPLLVGAMTGGTGDDSTFNRDLAAAAQKTGVGLCLGSIRPALRDKKLLKEFQVRDVAPDIVLLSNIGGNQLAEYKPKKIVDTSKAIGADGILVHLNAAMELIQPEGDRNFKGVAAGIAGLIKAAGNFPVMVKQTGMGLSYGDSELLKKAGVTIVETAGAGGTSWVGVETLRAENQAARLGQMLWDFGIPTAVSTAWMVDAGFETISSGGIQDSLDMAKALSLGAALTAVARPVLKAHVTGGQEGVEELLEELVTGLKYVMLCVGAKDLESLRHVPRVMGPRLSRYIETGWVQT